VLPNDNVLMSVGHLDHILIVYSSMEHVTGKSAGPMCGWVNQFFYKCYKNSDILNEVTRQWIGMNGILSRIHGSRETFQYKINPFWHRLYTMFRKKHLFVFSCIALRNINWFEWKYKIWLRKCCCLHLVAACMSDVVCLCCFYVCEATVGRFCCILHVVTTLK